MDLTFLLIFHKNLKWKANVCSKNINWTQDIIINKNTLGIRY